MERKRFDYSELEAAMAYAEQVTRETRRALDRLLRGGASKRTASVRSNDDAVSETAANCAGTTDQPTARVVTPGATTVVPG
jgi:hypothetical protein